MKLFKNLKFMHKIICHCPNEAQTMKLFPMSSKITKLTDTMLLQDTNSNIKLQAVLSLAHYLLFRERPTPKL